MVSGLKQAKNAQGDQIDLNAISDLLVRIIQKWRPLSVWLFGSRARGSAQLDSDWDLLVVVPDDVRDVDDPLAGWVFRKDLSIRADVLLCRSSDFREDRNTPNTIAFEAAHAGVQIYER